MRDGGVEYQIGNPATVLFGAAQQDGVGGGAFEVQLRPVLPGEPDAAVHLNGVGGNALQRSRTECLGDADRQCRVVRAVGKRPDRVVGRGPGML